jgi:hypothetical protein
VVISTPVNMIRICGLASAAGVETARLALFDRSREVVEVVRVVPLLLLLSLTGVSTNTSDGISLVSFSAIVLLLWSDA